MSRAGGIHYNDWNFSFVKIDSFSCSEIFGSGVQLGKASETQVTYSIQWWWWWWWWRLGGRAGVPLSVNFSPKPKKTSPHKSDHLLIMIISGIAAIAGSAMIAATMAESLDAPFLQVPRPQIVIISNHNFSLYYILWSSYKCINFLWS